jgi:AraC family transcriptional activator of tynA and feaB
MQSKWTTREVAPSDQFEYWRDVICDAFLPLEPILTDDVHFEGSVAAVSLRQFHIASVAAHPHTVARTSRGISRTRTGAFFANLIRTGTATARQSGNEAEAVAGDIVLLDTDEPFEFRMRGACDVLCLTIPDTWLRPRLGRSGLPVSPVVNARAAAGRLASRYLGALGEECEADLLDLEVSAFDHLCHLLARGDTPDATRSNARSVLLGKILKYVDDHLRDEALCAASVCNALGVSRSHLYAVLAESGTSFAAEVRDRRLHAIDRELRDPAWARSTIATLAYRHCFEDAASFTRAYRRLFSQTPSERRTTF